MPSTQVYSRGHMKFKTRELVQFGLILAVALTLSYVEILIPNPFTYPGIKLGLTNIVTVFILYQYNYKSAFLITMLRIFLANFLFGSLSSLIYSLAGGLVSLITMIIVMKLKFNIIATSICGGISHNIGQLALASIVVNNWNLFLTYLLVLVISGLLVGFFIGLVAKEFLKYYVLVDRYLEIEN